MQEEDQDPILPTDFGDLPGLYCLRSKHTDSMGRYCSLLGKMTLIFGKSLEKSLYSYVTGYVH